MMLLEELNAAELRALPRDRTVFFIPVGPIEDHGDALPVGLDLYEAKAVCVKTGELLEKEGWGCVLFPHAPLGIDSNTSALALRVRPHVLRDYLVDVCDSLARSGFKYFIALSGHPGPKQLTAIEEAGLFLRKRHSRLGFFKNKNAPVLISGSSICIDSEEKSRSALFMNPSEHGGHRDASVALACAGEFTNQALLSTSIKRELIESPLTVWLKLRRGERSGYLGDPHKANLEEGEAKILEKAKAISVKFRAGVEGGNPHQIFKSWYSLFPTNQSLFRIWILVILLAAILAGWTFYSLQGLLTGGNITY